MYHTAADGGNYIDQWAWWVPPNMPNGGAIYEIFVHVPNTNATSWQAPYVVFHADGNSPGVVDQYGLFNQWVSIGTYRMNPGSSVFAHDVTGDGYNQHCSGSWCELGVDAVKFVQRGTTYLPDVRYSGGWISTLTLRNNGGGYARILVKFLKSDGSIACTMTPTLFANQSAPVTCSNTQVASAVVDSSQDLSISIATRRTDRAYAASGINPGGAGDPAVEHAAVTLFAPALYYNAWN